MTRGRDSLESTGCESQASEADHATWAEEKALRLSCPCQDRVKPTEITPARKQKIILQTYPGVAQSNQKKKTNQQAIEVPMTKR